MRAVTLDSRHEDQLHASARPGLIALILIWAALVGLRASAPSDLLDNDQMRPALYALDVLRHGSWIVQHDVTGDIASKPPLYVWLVALLALAQDQVTRLSLYAPTALAVLAAAMLVWKAGRSVFGHRAAFFGALAFLCSAFAAKHVTLARTDALFCAAVCLSALCALDAWERPRPWGWTRFWLAAAAATLTKGPTGLLLASLGLIACLWERRAPRDQPRSLDHAPPTSPQPARSWPFALDHALGVVLYLAVAGGWFALAYRVAGQPFIDKVIGKELVGHAARSAGGGSPGQTVYVPSLYFLAWFAPWSIATLAGCWTVLTRPASEPRVRRFERFVFCWFAGGLLTFSIVPHQRPDLLLPIAPAAALLAGRELAGWTAALTPARLRALIVLTCAVFLTLVFAQRHVLKVHDPVVQDTKALKALARRLAALPDPRPSLIDVDTSFGLQYFLGTHQPRASYEQAAAALEGPEPVLVAARDPQRLLTLATNPSRARVVWTLLGAAPPHTPLVVLLSNDPAFRGVGPDDGAPPAATPSPPQ